jgi:hypothetical protein
MRQQIKDVMRYAGPRMLYHHPILAIRHIWDSIRRKKGRSLPAGKERGTLATERNRRLLALRNKKPFDDYTGSILEET